MFNSFEKLPEEKRTYILNTCMDEFVANGYTMANTVEIAKKSGIAKGSLFHYFGSKKSLFLYLVGRCMERVMNETHNSFSKITDDKYFDRVRKGVQLKMLLPIKFPKEMALLTRAFSERGHEAADELAAMARNYAVKMRELNSKYIGVVEEDLVREGVTLNEAVSYIQLVFDGITTRLLQQYAQNPKELLDNPMILERELEKAIDFILKGIGK